MAYKYNVIFNSAQQSRRKPTEDTRLALEFVDSLMDKMNNHGIKGYNPDKHARLGASVYKEHFRIVKETDWTLVIVTPGFFDDYWADYKNEAAFNYLTRDGNRNKLIPIAVHTKELGEINVNTPLFFDDPASWQDASKWERLKNMMLGTHENNSRTSGQPIQAKDDNTLRTNRQNIVTRPASQASFSSLFAENSLGGDAESLDLANDDSINNSTVFALSHSEGIPVPQLSPMLPSNLPAQNARAVTAGDVSIDGLRSNDTSQNGPVGTNDKDDTRAVDGPVSDNRRQQIEQTGDGEISSVLDSAPSLSFDSLTDEYETQVAHQMNSTAENANMPDIGQELNELRITDTNSRNDEDLYAQQLSFNQSHGQKRHDETQEQIGHEQELATGQTQNQEEKDSDIQDVAASCNTCSNVEGSGQGQKRLETAKTGNMPPTGVDVEKECSYDNDNANSTSRSAVSFSQGTSETSTSKKRPINAVQCNSGDKDESGVKEIFHPPLSDGSPPRESADLLNDDDLDIDYRQSSIMQSHSQGQKRNDEFQERKQNEQVLATGHTKRQEKYISSQGVSQCHTYSNVNNSSQSQQGIDTTKPGSIKVDSRGLPDGEDCNTTSRSTLETSMKHLKIADQNNADDDNDETAVKERLDPLRSDGTPQNESVVSQNDAMNLYVDRQQSPSMQSSGQGHGETRNNTDTSEPSASGASGHSGISMSSVTNVFNLGVRFVKWMYEGDKAYN